MLVCSLIESSNPAHGEVYSIQQYVIKFVGDLRKVGSFSVSSGLVKLHVIVCAQLKPAPEVLTPCVVFLSSII